MSHFFTQTPNPSIMEGQRKSTLYPKASISAVQCDRPGWYYGWEFLVGGDWFCKIPSNYFF